MYIVWIAAFAKTLTEKHSHPNSTTLSGTAEVWCVEMLVKRDTRQSDARLVTTLTG